MADDPIIADDELLARARARAPQAIPLSHVPDDSPPAIGLVPQSGNAPVLPAAQTARPVLMGKSGEAIPVGRHAAIPGFVNPDKNGEPGLFNPPHEVGVAQLASKAENIHNPFLRAMAKVGAYGARALDTAGTILAPRITAAIPGTTVNQAVKVGAERRNEAEQAKIGLEKAQAQDIESQEEQRRQEVANPKVKGTPEEQAFAYLMTQTDPATGKPYTPMAAFTAANQAKQDVKPTPRAEQAITADEANTINEERKQQWGVLHPNAELPPSYMSKAGDTRDVVKEADERFGRLGGAEGAAATRENTEAQRKLANQTREEGAADRKSAKDIALKEKVLTYWQPTLDSAERVNVMAKNYRDGVDNHNQQAMLSLLANHLGMTMGLQKGARMNKDIIQEAQKSQPWLAGIKSKFDKDGYLSGVTLSPEQMKQMLDLGFERYREDVKKSRSMAGYIGVTEEPPRHISRESVGYYVEGAGGDPAKAREMAKQDGWTF